MNLLEQIFLCLKSGYRAFGRVAQRLAKLVDGGMKVVFDIDEGVWPEALLQLFTSENVAGAFKQNGQDSKRLAAKFQFDAGFAKFSRCRATSKAPKRTNRVVGRSTALPRTSIATILALDTRPTALLVASVSRRTPPGNAVVGVENLARRSPNKFVLL